MTMALPTGRRGGGRQAPSSGGGGRPRSFLVGTQDVLEGGDYDQTVSSGVGSFAATALPPWTLQATGWLARLWFYFTYTSTAGTGVQADGPWNFIGTVQLNDVNNEAIFGPFGGYVWFVTNKYGGYYFLDDPSYNSVYTASGTAGTFILTIPLEIVSRDPIGAVASVNNTATLTVLLITNTASTALTGALTASSLRVRGLQEFYWEPRKQDKQGREIAGAPPANGTTQYWTQGSVTVAGATTINQQLITGLGYPFREYIFIYYDIGGTRATGETDWPDPLIGLKFEANFLLTQYNKAQWQAEISRCTGYLNAAFDTRGPLATTGASTLGPGKENGVYPLFFNKDFFMKRPGSETRRTYLVTSPGSNFIFNGAVAAGGTLYSIVNYVAPGGGGGAGNATARHQDTMSLTGGQ
jgi:hypothetical protein